ncbi:MAG: hypothetical protein V4484_10065 [Pseudomonadota bacterium]
MNPKTLMAIGMLALAGAAAAGDGKLSGVRQTVKVDARGGKVVLEVSVENDSGKLIYVPKAAFQDKELFGRTFDMTLQPDGTEVDYVGPMVKRGPFTKADFVAVKPGATRSNKIDITRSFAFAPGTHSYRLAYTGTVLGELSQLASGTALALSAPPANFTYSAN